MDSFEFNKIAGAVLGTLLFAMAVGVLSDAIFANHPPETPGYEIAIPEMENSGDAPAAPKETPLPVLLANASASAGENGVRACQACHTFEQGGANKVGPNLWNVVGSDVLGHADFNYSSGMKEWGADKTWTFAHLDAFLKDPRGTVPGTAMSFAGISNDEKRADVIVYLRSLSDNPVALPPVPEQIASADTGTATDASGGSASDGSASGASEGSGDTQTAAASGSGSGSGDASSSSNASAPSSSDASASTSGDSSASASGDAASSDSAQASASGSGDASGSAAGGGDAFVQMVAAANPDDGKRQARVCQACHSFDKGGPNKVGPNLWAIVNSPVIHPDNGYSYSSAMKEWGADKTWTYDLLNKYLEAPMDVVPGTKMAFAGVKDEEDRAELVAYLRSLADTPAPLPGGDSSSSQ